jgi:regulator of sigma E protease
VADWNEMRSLVTGSSSGTVQLTVRRGDNVFSPVIALDSTLAGTDGKLIGITQSMPVRLHERFSLGESIVNGGLSTALIVAQTYSGLYQLIKAPSSLRSNIGSPVMMVPMGQQVARRGLSDVLFLLGTISVLLAIMNLLPIPVLDGGLILFCLYEGLFRKPLSVRTQQVLQQIGAALLLFLMIFAIYNDAAKLVTRGVSLREQTQVIRQ